MSLYIYYLICTLLTLAVLLGIWLMSRVQTAKLGNQVSAISTLVAIVLTMIYHHILPVWTIYLLLGIGAVIGLILARRVQMIQMPQLVALLNGIGGGASALVGLLGVQALALGKIVQHMEFAHGGSMLAVFIGMITLSGSLVAAGKLHKLLAQKPVIYPAHSLISALTLIVTLLPVVWAFSTSTISLPLVILTLLGSMLFGYLFAIRVGGADMPITISLLNSLSGLAGAIAGMATGDLLLIAIGGVVGASGLLLTQIMCRAMNRSLWSILLGSGIKQGAPPKPVVTPTDLKTKEIEKATEVTLGDKLRAAREVIIVPGYGMALSQAQHEVRTLEQKFTAQGARVRYAIHPVAGRMPGHMNVLLAEADVDYESLYEMDAINGDFSKADLVIVIGANDVLNPAAREAEGTPIYGMPVLNVDEAKEIIICNFDLSAGYAGVPNPLYTREEGVHLRLGDAKESLKGIISDLEAKPEDNKSSEPKAPSLSALLRAAREVIIVPGYGMALSQAQHEVRTLEQKFTAQGARVRYAIHPVAGRMPGHMNVLLAEADVDYESLYEMDAINGDFSKADLVIVIGANDVLNPAAREAEGTPIYGMPVLNVDEAKEIIICNFDLSAGYAGVPNPLYTREEGVHLRLGDAKESLKGIISDLEAKPEDNKSSEPKAPSLSALLRAAREVIIVPGYGMALSQAQHEVRTLEQKFTAQGARVRYAIHPVAGRMPGHMNVLLAEADVDYESLYEMDAINGDFSKADLVIVIGANDVLNPAAREAEGTPIYGMPVLNVDEAKEIIICNFDLSAGYAGVPNPLYTREEGVHLRLGDAKKILNLLIESF